MTTTQATSLTNLETIVIEPTMPAQSCVIWLHGLGADGQDLLPLLPELQLPEKHTIRFVFPHAPWRPVTINGQQTMRAWYDILTLNKLDKEDAPGLQEACSAIQTLTKQQALPHDRIVLAGFSQGGAVALATGLTHTPAYAGIIALSTYLPHISKTPIALQSTNLPKNLPILQCHGKQDDVIPLTIAQETADFLKQHHFKITWKEYDMSHTISKETVQDIRHWLKTHLL